MSTANNKTEWEWSIIAQSTVMQKAWTPLCDALLGDSQNFPSQNDIMQYTWWPYAIWSLFEQSAGGAIKIKGSYKAKELIETVYFIRELASKSTKTEIQDWYTQGLFDAYLYRLCTTKPPKRLSKNLYRFIKSRSLDTISVETGSYWVGKNGTDQTSPFHMIKTGNFSIGVFPVTQLLWYDTMNKSPSKYKGSTRPVEQVSWMEALSFCNALSKNQGREPYYKINEDHIEPIVGSNGYRLPTEAQWELAARAEKSYGSARSDSAQQVLIDKQGWFDQTSGTRPIGQKPPNGFGLYDIFGNVFEWCWDYYGSYQHMVIPRGQKKPYFFRDPKFSKGPQTGLYRCYRGGCWNLSKEYALPFHRMAGRDDMKSSSIGLRLVCTD